MECLTVTKDIAIRAILSGACYVPKIGTPVSEIPAGDLIWSERMFSKTELEKMKIPLWVLSGYGYGDGSGYGDGKDPIAKILALEDAA